MLKSVIATAGLIVLWLLMSGIWDKPLILGFGVISIAVTLIARRRLLDADKGDLDYPINPVRLVSYTGWLLKEIAVSNLAVTKLILSGRTPDNQKLLLTAATQQSDINKVIYANSITLTPGTITVETEDDQFLVHALDFEESDRQGLEEMDRRVTAIETIRSAP